MGQYAILVLQIVTIVPILLCVLPATLTTFSAITHANPVPPTVQSVQIQLFAAIAVLDMRLTQQATAFSATTVQGY